MFTSYEDREDELAKSAERQRRLARAALSSPFGDTPEERSRLAQQPDDSLRKSAGVFSVGDRVKDLYHDRFGRITAAKTGSVEVKWDDGAEARLVASMIESADTLTKRATDKSSSGDLAKAQDSTASPY